MYSFLGQPQGLAPRLTSAVVGLALLTAFGGSAQAQATFAPVVNYPAGGTLTTDLRVADLNGDGRADLVAVNYQSDVVSVLLGQAGGTFGAAATTATGAGSGPGAVEVGDVNGDGRLDVVVANNTSNTAGVLLGLAAGGLGAPTTYSVGANSSPYAVAMRDLNGDGRLDIVTANNGTATVGVLLGQAGGTFAAVTTYATAPRSQPSDVRVGDVNGDGRLDIVTADGAFGTLSVLLGLAAGGFAPVAAYFAGPGSSTYNVALGDVNRDGRVDLVTSDASFNTAGVLLGLAAGGFGPITTYPSGGNAALSVALGDVNGDGRLDIVTINNQPSTAGVLLGQASGGFAPVTTFSVGANAGPSVVLVRDANGDGRPDILTANTTSNSIGVLLNTGTFTPLAAAPGATAADVSLFPNPAHEGFTVRLPATLTTVPVQAELLNALGQVVRRQAAAADAAGASLSVDTNGLAAGVYTLRLHAGSTTLAKRVVIE